MAMAVGARDGMEQGQEQVRLKLSYRGRTFRRSVDVRAFTWEAFLRWGLECFPAIADPASVTMTYEDEDGDRPTVARAEDFAEAVTSAVRLNRPLRIHMEDATATATGTGNGAMQAPLPSASASGEDNENEDEDDTVVVDPVFPRAGSQRHGAATAAAAAPATGVEMGTSGVTLLEGSAMGMSGSVGGSGVFVGGIGDSQSTHPLNGAPNAPPPPLRSPTTTTSESQSDASAAAAGAGARGAHQASSSSSSSSSSGGGDGSGPPPLGAIPTITAEVLAAIQAGLLRGTGTGTGTGDNLPIPGGSVGAGVSSNQRVGVEAVQRIAREQVLPGVVALLNQPEVRSNLSAVMQNSLGLAQAFVASVRQTQETQQTPSSSSSSSSSSDQTQTQQTQQQAQPSSSVSAPAEHTRGMSCSSSLLSGSGASGGGGRRFSPFSPPQPTAPEAAAAAVPSSSTDTPFEEEQGQGQAGPVVHYGVRCDKCHRANFEGVRFKDAVRRDFDMCEGCAAREHPNWPFPLLMIRDPSQAPAAILTVLPPERDIAYEHDATRTHANVQCDGCGVTPIVGNRYSCGRRRDYDLCEACVQQDATGFPMLQIARPSQAPAFFHVTPTEPTTTTECTDSPTPTNPAAGSRHRACSGGGGAGAKVGAHYYHPRFQRGCWRRNAIRSRREQRAASSAAVASSSTHPSTATATATADADPTSSSSSGSNTGGGCNGGGPILGQIARAFLEGAGLRCPSANATGTTNPEAAVGVGGEGDEGVMRSSLHADLLQSAEGLTEEELLARALSLSTALDPPTTTDLPVAEYVAHVDAALPLATAAVSLPLPTDEGQQEGNDSAGQGVQVEEAAEEEEEAAEEEEENASNTNNTNGSSSASNAPRGRLPYASRFVADVTYPDGTQVAPRTAFRKTWRLANTGGRPFPADARLVFAYGHLMDGPMDGVAVGAVPPGQEFSVSVPLIAPGEAAQYIGCWQLEGTDPERGDRLSIGSRVWVDITVEEDRCGAASEWEVVMAPMTEDDNENEENEENEEKEEEQEEQGGAKEEEKDEAWVRWEKELACLSEMGFFTQLDACVAVLERLRPTDAEGLQAVVDELLRLGDTKPEAEAGQEGQDQEQETTAAAAGAAAGGTDL